MQDACKKPAFSLRTIHKIIIILILAVLCPVEDILAQDTISLSKQVRQKPKKDPLRATMLAVAFPGLGQVYNRKYWKIPLVYAGFGALAYSVSFNTSHYNQMMKAYQDFTDNIPETDSYIPLIKWADPSTYDPVLYPKTYNPSNKSWVEDNLLKSVDYYKRYRDLSYIGIAAWYLISVLDANVDASLSNFDVTKNLNFAFSPFTMPVQGFLVAGLNISVNYTF